MEIKVRPSARIGDYERGVAAERERIIKLLEERSKCGYEHNYDGYCFCEEIALIKGKNK